MKTTLFVLAATLASPLARAQSFELSPKLFAKSSSGILGNVGTVQGSGFSVGGVHVGGLFFILPNVALGIGYKVESDFKSIPLKGVDLIGRYYYLGPGTLSRSSRASGDSIVRHGQWNPYAGFSFSNRSYNVENTPSGAAETGETTFSGNVSAFNALAGLDYRLTARWELSTEIDYTIIPFGGSDPRVKMKWMMFSMGTNFLF